MVPLVVTIVRNNNVPRTAGHTVKALDFVARQNFHRGKSTFGADPRVVPLFSPEKIKNDVPAPGSYDAEYDDKETKYVTEIPCAKRHLCEQYVAADDN